MDASLLPSPRKREVSPIQESNVPDSSVVPKESHTDDTAEAFAPFPPPTTNSDEPVLAFDGVAA